jgi:hypothetical protein
MSLIRWNARSLRSQGGYSPMRKTMGPIVQIKEIITVNCVMPRGIKTPVMPDFGKASLSEQMTPKSNLVSGYDVFLNNHQNIETGQTLEVAHDKLIE